MRLTVIVPVYNAEKFLARALESVRVQIWTDWECICVDDGSFDGSVELLDKLAKQDARFVVIHQSNAGVSAARNAGLDRARGEWITFLDADDWVEPMLYAQVLARLDEVPTAQMLWHRAYVTDVDGQDASSRVTEPRIFPNGDAVLAEVVSPYKTMLYCVWDKFFRRDEIERQQLRFDSRIQLGEDALFVAKYLSMCGSVMAEPQLRGYHYEIVSTGAIRNMTLAMCQQQMEKFEVLYACWLSSRRPGITQYLRKDAAAMPSLGKHFVSATPLRELCIELLLGSNVFRNVVIPFLFWHGSVKSRAFALMYRALPKGLKRRLLQCL